MRLETVMRYLRFIHLSAWPVPRLRSGMGLSVAAILLVFAAGGSLAAAEPFYLGPPKDKPDWVVTWKTNGAIGFETRAEGMAVVAREGVTGFGARQFAAGSNEWGHLYKITISGRSMLSEGDAEAYLIARDEKGRTAVFQGFGPLGKGGATLRDLVRISENIARFEIGLRFKNARGEVLVSALSIEPFDGPKELPPSALPKGPTLWAATGMDRTYGMGEFEPRRKDTALKLFAAAGVLATRGGLRWESAESEKGRADFGPFVEKLNAYKQYGISVPLVCLGGTPAWASGKNPQTDIPESEKKKLGPYKVSHSFWAPTDWGDWERFVEGAARAAKGTVKVWEIINEPDLSSEGFMGRYEEYREYLRHAYLAIKRADPSARVFTGAFVKGDWLLRLYSEGATNWFDGVCSHPYSSTAAGSISVNQTLLLRGQIFGAPKESWITEVGFQSGWKDGPGLVNDEAQKAREGALALRGLAAQSELVTWYSGNEKGNMYGLNRIEANGALRPMPVYYEMGAVTGRLPKGKPQVAVSVEVPQKVAVGEMCQVRLTASNTSGQPQTVKLWPVGFLDALGPSHHSPGDLDLEVVLAPGGFRRIAVDLRPEPGAKGAYPVGLAVIGVKENTLEFADLNFGP